MSRLVFKMLRPYHGWLLIVFVAMLVEIAMSLAAPWPLKLILDDALGSHHLPDGLAWAHEYGFGRHTMGVALFAGIATLVIAVIGAAATYIDNYYTTSIGQWIANDMRIRIYAHLQRLSLRYFDHVESGSLMSTITTDVATLQSFASSSTLEIFLDFVTIIFMVGFMFWLNWDFTLIALGITPFLVVFVFHFEKAVREVTRTVRQRQSDILAVVEEPRVAVLGREFGVCDGVVERKDAARLAAEADGFGKWTLIGTTLTIYRHDGVTVARVFVVDSSTDPTERV